MALTKVTGQVIKNTTDVTVGVLTVTNTLAVGGTVSIGGTLTYEDVTNVDAVGLITARNGIVVGSGITLSKDGDIFATGITTVSGNVKVGTGITLSPDGDGFFTGVVTATSYNGDGSNLTGIDLSAVTGATGDFSIADKIVHTGDTNTAIRFPAADTVTVETGGSERLRVGSGGDVSIGGHATNYADSPLEVRGTNAGGDVAIRVTNNSTDAGTQAGVIFTTTTSDFTTAGIGYERGGTADALRFYVGQSSGAGGFDNATERLRIDSNGMIGFGGVTPKTQNTFDAIEFGKTGFLGSQTGARTVEMASNAYYNSGWKYKEADVASQYYQYQGYHAFTNAVSGSADGAISFVERLRITSGGKVLIGDDTAENTIGLNANVQTFGTDASTSSVAIRRGSNDAQAAFLVMSKSRNTSVGSRTILQNGDEVGNIFFAADDGTDLVSNTAAIKSQINGTPGANDTPGNLSFWTTADGANSATQRMTIDSSGYVTKPAQFHIVVQRSGNQTGYNPSQGFGTGIIFNSVAIVQGTDSSVLDTSNGRVTVPVAGIYFLEASGYSDTAVFTQGWFTKNGSRLAYSDFMDNVGNSQNVNSVGFHKLAANDTIGFKAYGSSSTSATIVETFNHTWMRITLVG